MHRFALLLPFLLSWFPARADAQEPAYRVVANLPTVSLTQCDSAGNPEVLVTEAALRSPLGEFYLIHELVHVRQMRVAGGCGPATVRYEQDPDFRQRMELEAYCVEATAMQMAGLSLDQFVVNSLGDPFRFSFYLFLVYGRHRTLEETEQLVHRECPLLEGI